MASVVTPFPGLPVTLSYQGHIDANVPIPGTDYKTTPGYTLIAAASGRATLGGNNGFTPGESITITLSDGDQIHYREVGKHEGNFPRNVVQGAVIGKTSSKFAHIDATINGHPAPFENLLDTSTTTTAGTGAVIPIKKDTDMPTRS